MYFNKILASFSLAVLSLGHLNFLPVYATGPLTSSSLCSKEDEEEPSCGSGILSQSLSREASKKEPSHTRENHPLFPVFKTAELKDHIAGLLSPQDRESLAETCVLFSNVAENSRIKKNFSFSMENTQEDDLNRFDLFLQRHSECKDLRIFDLNWDFLSSSLKRIKTLNPDFKFPALKALSLGRNAITFSMLQEMGEAFFSIMPQLEILNLANNKIGPEGVQYLAESLNMMNLISLDLSDNDIGPEGSQYLATSPHMKKLISLSLGGNDIGPEGSQHLATSPPIKKLISLDLSNNDIGDTGVQHLAVSLHMSNLTYLNLEYNTISDIGVQYLAESPYMGNLISLDLSGNEIGPLGAQNLATSLNMKNLTSLNLEGNDIGPEGSQHLAISPHMKNLTSMDLSNNDIGDVGAQYLAASPYMKNLIPGKTLFYKNSLLLSLMDYQ